MKNRILFLLFLLTPLLWISCNRSNSNAIFGSATLPFLIDCQTMTHTPNESLDSETGTVICNDITFNYDYGRYGSDKPVSLYESFSKSFYAYHYSKFFEATYVDEKVRDILKDSISILEVSESRLAGKYIVDCPSCDGFAKINFMDNDYFYAFNTNKKAIENHNNYNISIENMDRKFYKKTFTSNKQNHHGVYIAATGNLAKNRRKNKLIVVTNQPKSSEIEEILRSITLK